jgi:FkbM family methyltransferase
MRSVQGRFGETWYYGKDEFVGKSFHNYGEFSGEESDIILGLANKNKLSLDIGANIGAMAQMFEYYDYPCIAWEPQSEIYKLLKKNFHGEAHNCALGSADGTAEMPKLRWGARYNYGGMSLNTTTELGHYTVPVKTLDSYNLTNVGFMKIDVEGWEEEVLKGAKETILRDRPIMYIEDDRKDKSVSLQRFIKEELGYTIEKSIPPLYRANNFFGLARNVWAPNNYISENIICRPC